MMYGRPTSLCSDTITILVSNFSLWSNKRYMERDLIHPSILFLMNSNHNTYQWNTVFWLAHYYVMPLILFILWLMEKIYARSTDGEKERINHSIKQRKTLMHSRRLEKNLIWCHCGGYTRKSFRTHEWNLKVVIELVSSSQVTTQEYHIID